MPAESENYYDDSPKAAGQAGEKPQPEESDEGEKTSILPKSFFGGKELKPGGKCTVEVVAVHENDVEVKYSHDESEEEEKGEKEESDQPQKAQMPSDMQSMME